VKKGGLALYKSGPVRIGTVGDKIEIELVNGKTKRVRSKDITPIHPGPVGSAKDETLKNIVQSDLSLGASKQELDSNIHDAWELMDGEPLPLADIAELIYEEITPQTIWNSWRIVSQDLYFHGTPLSIQGYPADRVETVRSERVEKERIKRERSEFIERLQSNSIIEDDHPKLSDVEMLALGKSEMSAILRDIKREQRPENAHHLLLETGYWDENYNPYPARMGVELESVTGDVAELPTEERVDLTHLKSWAIDDEGNQDPDDAISLEVDKISGREKIWVHVADVAALIEPDSELDIAARAQCSNLYLPEGTITMLPRQVTEILGLGLQEERSPALSFGFTVSTDGKLKDVTTDDIEVVTSWVKVTRTTYAEVDANIDDSNFAPLYSIALLYQQRRLTNGAINLDLPEVKISVKSDSKEIKITPLPKLKSRELVTNFMLMAGEAAARFAENREIPFPHSTQQPPKPDENGNPYPHPETPAEMYNFRKLFQRSQLKSQPDLHAGLGMEQYSQVTSPLRRYLDLVAHQQLRAWIHKRPLLDHEEITERIGAAEAVIGNTRRAERFSNRHWSMVWLRHNPEWTGDAILVDMMRQRGTFLIPELGIECRVRLQNSIELNSVIKLKLSNVDLPELTPYFRVGKN